MIDGHVRCGNESGRSCRGAAKRSHREREAALTRKSSGTRDCLFRLFQSLAVSNLSS
jgi:hypothetical protein